MSTYVVNVKEIDKKYVGNDCVQIMPSFEKSLSIFGKKGLTFYGRGYQENKVDNNVYITDERKHQFPYSDVPWHWTRKHLVSKILYVNQIFDFNKPYILLRDGLFIQCYVAKHEDKTYIINSSFKPENEDEIKEEYVKKNEIYNFFKNLISANDGNLTYVLDSTGKHRDICYDDEERQQKKYKLIEFLKQKKLLDGVQGNDIWYSNSEFILEDNFILPINDHLFIVKIVGTEIKIRYVYLSSLDENMVKVTTFKIPTITYDEQQINDLIQQSKNKLREPIFSRGLGIPKDEYSKGRTLVKKKDK